jgi:hypothetical protein
LGTVGGYSIRHADIDRSSARKRWSQAEFGEQILRDHPITITRATPIGVFEVVLQILLYPVVIEQRVVDVYQEDSEFS